MKVWSVLKTSLVVVLATAPTFACDGEEDGSDLSPSLDVVDDAPVDALGDIAIEDSIETADTCDASDDALFDAHYDAVEIFLLDVIDDAEVVDETDAFPFTYVRQDDGEPIDPDERAAFTRRVLKFLTESHYFDWILYTSYGVGPGGDMPDWQFIFSEHFKKEGDLVTFYHPVNEEDGGHNLHTPNSRALADLISAWLITGDSTAGLATEKLCKGVSASMKSMVFGEDDEIHHLMTRNMIPAYYQEVMTHDGKRKGIDPSGWFYPYQKWNCDRYYLENNPWWGPMWITNLRSKDDVPYIFTLIPNLKAVADGPDGSVKDACVETLELLTKFATDIVEHDFQIRTKAEDGTVYSPGYSGNEEDDAEKGDISSFTYWTDIIPEAECNARASAELIATGLDSQECGDGGRNVYDEISFINNRFNTRINRFFHLAHIANAISEGKWESAELLLSGLEARMYDYDNMTEEEMKYSPSDWWRSMALYRAEASVWGYPLTSDDVRQIWQYYDRALVEFSKWPYWDPWSADVPEGDLGPFRPSGCTGSGAEQECWWDITDIATIFEACWSPWKNPDGVAWVDCDIVRDRSKWAEPVGPFTAVSFNTGTSEGMASADPDDAYDEAHGEASDLYYGDGLAYLPAVEATTVALAEISPEVIVFQEMFYSGNCPDVPESARADFVCQDWTAGDPTVAQMVMGQGYQVVCHPEKDDKCVAVKKTFGKIRGCDDDLCMDSGLTGFTVPDCGKGARVARGVIDLVSGGTLTLVSVHGSSGMLTGDMDCRVGQFRQIFENLGDGRPAADGLVNLIMGDFNTDPVRLVPGDTSADYLAENINMGGSVQARFSLVNDIDAEGPGSYGGLFDIDLVISDYLTGTCRHEQVFSTPYFDHIPIVCEF